MEKIENGRIMHATIKTKGKYLTIINVYAPQSLRPIEEKINFYEEVEREHDDRRRTSTTMIIGDFNARLQARCPGEESYIGEFVFGRGKEYIATQHPRTTENRELFMEYCQENKLTIPSAQFDETINRQATYANTTNAASEES